MTAVRKIDSNVTGLRYSRETSLGVADGSAIWYPFEPNSYSDFGGDITTIARNPINASRQRQKGVVTDLAAAAGFNTDLTQTNLQDILQGFFFADFRRKGEEVATAVNGANAYLVASTAGFAVGSLVFASGFTTSANNGLKHVTAVVANTSITVSETLVTELASVSTNSLVVVGQTFIASMLDANATADLPQLVNNAVSASNILTITSITNLDGEVVTFNGQIYTFRTTLTAPTTANEVHIGASVTTAGQNLTAAINNAGGVPGTDYGSATVANAAITASNGAAGVVNLTAIIAGTVGNAITTTEGLIDGTLANAATLHLGTGISFLSLGLVAGEWIFVGGDSAGLKFVAAADNGFMRIRSVADKVLTLDKTSSTITDETGTGLTVEMYFGRVVKNEVDPTLIVRRSYQLERLLGAPDDASPTQIQSEYIIGAIANQFKLNYAQANKITADLTFVGIDREQRSGVTGVKAGTRPAIVASNAFNTSSDFKRLKMTVLDPANSNPTALFAYVTQFDMNLNNNVVPDKAISVLGAFDVTAGQFTVDGTATAYFSDIAAITAVRNNSDVSLDWIVVKANAIGTLTVNQGVLVDMPLLAVGGGKAVVAQDKAIELPLTLPAAADRNFNHTLLVQFFDYMPNAALP